MGLFDKKFCDICGDKIGLLGNRKLENGNCCKNCAAKLSPWFSERRHSTVEDIKEQLAYREKNKETVAAFRPTRKYGDAYKKLMVDEKAGKFTIASEDELKKGNPDILDLSDITNIRQDNSESSVELKQKDKEGKYVSYVPKKYKYTFDFAIQLDVRHPYIDDMNFKLNASSIELERRPLATSRAGIFADYGKYKALSDEVYKYLVNIQNPQSDSEAQEAAPSAAATTVQTTTASAAPVEKPAETGSAETETVVPGASLSWTCPCCTATNTGDICEYCGSPRP